MNKKDIAKDLSRLISFLYDLEQDNSYDIGITIYDKNEDEVTSIIIYNDIRDKLINLLNETATETVRMLMAEMTKEKIDGN